ncbi:unnamed protein product [Prorocentrum cordatum]|uniref:O-methyltransferase C-terminal domain-containing protein n=1 Tax=Prorocentrum cordatum TaxID=2364126 RepID=A0ABN9UP78_9DINO|nr:unnamed protein product [Polarella glacialis]
MGELPNVMTSGEAPSYASWFSDPEVARTYTQAQHNGSVATAKYLVKKKLQLGGITDMLDVGGGSGAFSYVFVGATPGLKSTVLELPEVCRTGEGIRAQQPEDVRSRVGFTELDATSPNWPVRGPASVPTARGPAEQGGREEERGARRSLEEGAGRGGASRREGGGGGARSEEHGGVWRRGLGGGVWEVGGGARRREEGGGAGGTERARGASAMLQFTRPYKPASSREAPPLEDQHIWACHFGDGPALKRSCLVSSCAAARFRHRVRAGGGRRGPTEPLFPRLYTYGLLLPGRPNTKTWLQK